ncbi:MMPL family transporter [Cohnella hashimotonis]|uniref:MMPL family transporter n=1 Tax=Cohnella hashimotonis TaxID=2826895 RepID=A0ABT6TK54_9BACL|nr:MMPL family transporter [Cohnella hashimotonis]MDI4647114.1 MMPL family transporter [Cohnella hashimotonis]
MANILYRIGGWAARWRKSTLGGGIIILLLLAVVALRMGPVFEGDMSIPGTESEKAANALQEKFPSGDAVDGGTIQLVFKAAQGKSLESAETKKVIQTSLNSILQDQNVASVADPYSSGAISANKEIGYATITYKLPAADVTEKSVEDVERQADKMRKAGIQVEKSGTVGSGGVPEIGGISEVIGIAMAFIILLVMFRSVLTAGLPIVIAIFGLGIGVLLILIGSNFIDMSAVTLTLAVMLGLAVGIDYGLFILSRHRQNMLAGMSIRESIANATGTAGSAVVFAGMTVIIALAGLSVTRIPFLSTMGLAAALTVFIAVLTAIVIVPAMLSLLGERILPKAAAGNERNKKLKKKPATESNAWGRFITKFPLPVAVAGILLLSVISLPALHLQIGLPNNGMKSEDTTERQAYDLLSEGFGPGFNGPLVVLATADGTNNSQSAIEQATAGLSKMEGVASAAPPILNAGGDAAIISVIPKSGPLDKETGKLVSTIRGESKEMESQYGVKLMVTGSTAVDIDISKKLNNALPTFGLLVVGLAFVLLLLVFRSLLVPLKAVLGYLLTMTATLGFVVFVVQDGHFANLFGITQSGPVLNFLPLLTAGILFGLAMDYEVFLVSRMREKFIHARDAKGAILFGIKSSGSVVTAAGLIMVCVFAGFIFMDDTMIKSMGLALAFGILFDAFVVRLAILPAIMSMLGRHSWYLPKWLDRILPNIDVEGAALEEKSHKITVDNRQAM